MARLRNYDCNNFGQLDVVINPDSSFISYSYDNNGNKISMINNWDTTSYTFDSLNRMKTVIADNGDVTEYFYNPVGNRDSISHANGTSVGYDYDNLNRLTNVTNYSTTGTTLSSYAYELNGAGIRTSVTEEDGSVVTYLYDDLYRLTSEARAGDTVYNISYIYDNVGNRTSKTHDGVTTTYVYNNRDQLTSETTGAETITYTFDASGRKSTKVDASGTTTYNWTDNDRLSSVVMPSSTVNYIYDADGNKVSMNDGTEKRYLIDSQQPYAQVIAEYSDVDNVASVYVYGLERVSQDRGGVVSTYLADGQGSIRLLVDGNGAVTDTYDYFAFGEELSRSGSTVNEFRYVGESFDPNSGFYYLRARWMNPESGRFESVDPFAGDPMAPISLHRYLYANQSPISYFDPSGEMSIQEMSAAATTLGYLVRAYSIHISMFLSRFSVWASGVGSGRISTLEAVVANSVHLGKNLINAGFSRPAGAAAHHIVAGTARLAGPARAVLTRYGVTINDAVNGVFLPHASPNAAQGAYHRIIHTTRYYERVNELLLSAASRQEVIEALEYIRKALLANNANF